MPRRVAGPIWAIRLTMTLTPEEERELSIPNMVCVYHAGGSRGRKDLFQEKPHYHLYYNAGSEVTKDKVQELVKANTIVSKYYKASNGFWSVDTDPKYDLDTYWEYVWRNYPTKRQRLIFWNIEEPQKEIPDLVVPCVVAPGPLDEYRGTANGTIKVQSNKKTSLEKQQKFLRFCKDMIELDGKEPNEITPRKVFKYLYEYCKENGHTTEYSCFTYVNYVISNIHTGTQYKESRRRWADRMVDKFF